MSDKPSYKLARQERKGESSMEIESADKSKPIVDLTKPEKHGENLIPPDKPGLHMPGMSSNPNAKPGESMEPAPKAIPEDWKRPNFTDVVKT